MENIIRLTQTWFPPEVSKCLAKKYKAIKMKKMTLTRIFIFFEPNIMSDIRIKVLAIS